MSQRHLVRAALAALLALGTAACGSDSGTDAIGQFARNALQLARPEAAPTPVTQQQIEQVLAGTEGAVALVEVESRAQQAVVVEIERNGSYVTYGSPSRQTVTLRNGVLTATRGLGGDLMSLDAPGLDALIRNRASGTVTRSMRFLDGEDLTKEYDLSCKIVRDGIKTLQSGVQALRLTETCRHEGATVTNTYLVDDKGRVLESRQWSGAFSGHLSIRQLRF